MTDALAPSTKTGSIREAVVRTNGGRTLTYRLKRRVPLSRLLSTLLGGLLGASTGPAAFALPVGGQVTAGQATVTQPNGQTVKVNQSTSTAVLNWQSFSIAGGETVIFAQPSSTSVALNRVLGTSASSIYGSLIANGQVFLINPNGILFGKTATVNVGGLVASTLNLTDKDFLQGNYTFTGTGGSVTNEGSIRGNGGLIALVGSNVSNSGTIQADGGAAVLAAGSRVNIDPNGNGLIAVSVDPGAAASIVNEGAVIANGGSVIISAKTSGALLDTVINTSGIVRASSIGGRSGSVMIDGGSTGIVAVSGEVSASGTGSGAKGGTITVLGDKVGLFDGAKLNASGDAGGGTVLVGGNAQGVGPLHNASATYVAPGAVIVADASVQGDGGQVVVWSDASTKFLGTATARGGAQGGDGGNVETSSAGVLFATGKVDASAPKGKAGQWLLDPNDIVIADTIPTGPPTYTPLAAPFDSATDDSYVSTASLTAALTGNGTTVSVSTRTQGGSAEQGNITVSGTTSTGLAAGETATLNLNAAGSIVFAGGVIDSGLGALNVNLNAGIDPASLARTATPSTIDASTGTIVTRGGDVKAFANGNITLGAIDTSSVTNPAGSLTVSTNAAGSILQSNNPLRIGVGNFTATNNAIALATGTNVFGGLATLTGGTTNVTAQGSLTARLATTGPTTLTAGGASTVTGSSGDVTTLNAAGPLLVTANTGQLHTNTTAGGTTTFGPTTVTGSLTTVSAGAVTQTGPLIVTDTTVVNAGTNAITLTEANDFVGQASFIGGTTTIADVNGLRAALNTGATRLIVSGPLTVSGAAVGLITETSDRSPAPVDKGTTVYGDLTVTGALNTTSSGAVGQTGPVLVTGTTVINAGTTNTVNLPGANNFIGQVNVSAGATTVNDVNDLTVVLNTGATNLTVSGPLTVSGRALGLITQTTDHVPGTGDGSTVFGDTTVTGALVATSSGAVGQTGPLRVTDTTFINAGTVNAINLLGANNFGGQATFIGGATQVADVDTLNAVLGTGATTLTVSGPLTVSGQAGGLVTQTTDHATAGDGSTVFGNLTVAGALSTTSSGAVGETGALAVTGATVVNAGSTNAINLNGPNDFGGRATFIGGATQVNDVNRLDALLNTGTAQLVSSGPLTVSGRALGLVTQTSDHTLPGDGTTVFGDTTVTGGLSTTSSGAVGQSGPLRVTGTTFINVGSGNGIMLTGANDFGGQATFVGGATQVNDANELRAVLNTGATVLTVSGPLTVAGQTAGNLTTATTDHQTAGDGTTVFGGVAVNGSLTSTSSGAVGQTGPIAVTNLSTINTGSDKAITLAGGNDFGGQANFSGGTTIVNDINGLNAVLNTGVTTLTVAGPLTVSGRTVAPANTLANALVTQTADRAAVGDGTTTFGDLTVTGGLSARSSGAVLESGAVRVTTLTAIDAGSNAITLTGANDFGGPARFTGGVTQVTDVNELNATLNTGATTLTVKGPLTVAGQAAGLATRTTDVATPGDGSTVFGTTTVSGALDTTSSGAVGQNGPLVVTGSSRIDATGRSLQLTNPSNDFQGVSTFAGGTTTVRDVNVLNAVLASGATTLTAGGALSVSGSAASLSTTTTAGGNTTFSNATIGSPTTNGNLAVNSSGGTVFGDTTVNGSLNATSLGAVMQPTAASALKVTGTTTIVATGQAVLLNGANDFGGVATITADRTVLNDVNGLSAALNTGDTTLGAGGPLAVSGSTGPLSTTTTGSSGTTSFGNVTVNGALASLSSGAVTGPGVLKVTGPASINAGANAITLTTPGTDFAGTATLTGGSTTVSDVNGLTAVLATGPTILTAGGALTVSGTAAALNTTTTAGGTTSFGTTAVTGALNVVSAGSVGETGPLTVGGTTTIGAAGNPITLTNGGNDFVGVVTLLSSQTATVSDRNDLAVALATSGPTTLTAGGGLTVSGNSAGNLTTTTTGTGTTTFAPTTVGGTLAVTSAGAVVETGPLAVTGPTTITSNGAVTLGAANQLSGPVSLTGSSVALNNTRDTALTVNSGGAASVTAAGRTLTVGGRAAGTLTTSAGTTIFGPLSAGALDVTATGDVAQTPGSAINIANSSKFVLIGSNLTLANANNVSFGTPVNVTLDRGKTARFRSTGAVPQFVVPSGASPDQQLIFFNDFQVTASQALLFSASVNAAAAAALNEELRRLFITDSAYQEIKSGTLEDFVIPTPNLTTKGLTQPLVRPCPPSSPSSVQDPKCAPNDERPAR